MDLKTQSSSDGSPIDIILDGNFTEIIAIYLSGSDGKLELIQDDKAIFELDIPGFCFIPFKFKTRHKTIIRFTPTQVVECFLNAQTI